MAIPAALTLGLPLLEVGGLNLHEGLVAFMAFAAATSLVINFSADSAHHLLTAAVHNSFPQTRAHTPNATHVAQTLGSLAFGRVGSEVNLLVKVTALVVLALSPFVA